MGHLRARQLLVFISVAAVFPLASPGPSAGQTRNPFSGSVPTGQVTGSMLDLSLQDAFQRALKYNLGEIESSQNARAAHAVRLRSLNALLPNLSARLSGTVQQLDLPSEGFNLLPIPGIHIPATVGPFGVADARAYVSQEIFNWSDIKNFKSAAENETAAQYSYKSDRNLVVFTTGSAYLLVISDNGSGGISPRPGEDRPDACSE